ncbi:MULTISPECIES: hypothetical protein [Paenibacillus]|uniref:hypothetical protein n=1 Tax=Paenibacillus TaxID=44249 RepID=UPI0011B5CA78|nr:hypothetical protein [Paenibacillus polymyxa]
MAMFLSPKVLRKMLWVPPDWPLSFVIALPPANSNDDSIIKFKPRVGYRPLGEQISIYLDERIYLLEAKWHADLLPPSTFYQLKGKVEGKSAGTIGIFYFNGGICRGCRCMMEFAFEVKKNILILFCNK